MGPHCSLLDGSLAIQACRGWALRLVGSSQPQTGSIHPVADQVEALAYLAGAGQNVSFVTF